MSIPNDALSTPPLPAQWLAPDSFSRPTRVVDFERGGVAISDPSQGRNVKVWRARLVGNDVLLGAEPYDSEVVLYSAPGITELTLAFDQNMLPLLAFVQNNQAKLRWYDPVALATVVTDLPAGVRSPYLATDDKRDSFSAQSDVLLFYILGSRLCYRQQRDRFQIERTLKWFVGNAVTIRRAGMGTGFRLQIELVGLQNRVLARPFLAGWTPTVSQLASASIAPQAPAALRSGDILCAAVVHRSALTVPTGWTLRASRACTNGTSQTLSVLTKNVVSPADSGVAFTFNCAAADFISAAMFAARAESGAASVLSTGSTFVDNTATNAVTAVGADATLLAGELHVILGTSINAQGITTTPAMPSGVVLVSGAGPNMRLVVGYQLRDLGQSISGPITFDNGAPSNNGLATITLRFGVPT